MKRLFFIALFAAMGTAALSCDGNEGTVSQKQLTGNWQWIESMGGIAGTTETPASTGNEIRLEITPGTIKQFTNGTLTNSKSYSIGVAESIFGGNRQMIIYDDETASQSFTLMGNELVLQDECADCYQIKYTRILPDTAD